MSGFVTAGSDSDRYEFPKLKITCYAQAKFTSFKGFSSCNRCCICRRVLQNLYRVKFLFVLHTLFKKPTKLRTARCFVPKKQRTSKFWKTLNNKGTGKRCWAVCSITSIDCMARFGANNKWRLLRSSSLSRTSSLYLNRCFERRTIQVEQRSLDKIG